MTDDLNEAFKAAAQEAVARLKTKHDTSSNGDKFAQLFEAQLAQLDNESNPYA